MIHLIAIAAAQLLAMFALIAPLAAQSTAAEQQSTAADAADESRIATLVKQLASDDFRQRERAEHELGRVGMIAVGQLVEQIVAGSPESAVRSIRVLSKIGIAATESDMSRVTRILQLLSQNGFAHLARPSARMATRWKQAQTQKTMQRIRDCGIEFQSTGDEFRGVVIDPGFRMPPAESGTPRDRPQSAPVNHLSSQQLLSRVEEILTAPDDVVEAALAEAITSAENAPPPSSNDSPILTTVILDGRAVTLNGQQMEFYRATISDSTTNVTEGLRLMALLPSVPHLEFSEREIGESDIQAMAKLTGLRGVTLNRCRYDARQMLEFIRQHPETTVTASGHDAFLGVSLQSVEEVDDNPFREGESISRQVCQVLTVVEDTAAAEAGIQEGDAILEVDDFPISTFSELVVVIASHAPGDTMKLKIRHDGQSREETVTLRERPVGQ